MAPDDTYPEDAAPEVPQKVSGPGKSPVPSWGIALLAGYLVLLSCLLILGIYFQWHPHEGTGDDRAARTTAEPMGPLPSVAGTENSAENTVQAVLSNPNLPSGLPAATTTPTESSGRTGSGAGADPAALGLSLETVSPPSGPVGSTMEVLVKGKGIGQGAVVLFGGVPGTPVCTDPGGRSINVLPPRHTEGEVDIVVRNRDGSTGLLKSAFTFLSPSISERSLFLIVLFAGGLGGALHALRSLSWYVGNRYLLKSWTLMYLLLPFTGALVALIFYVVIRAGFMPTQSTKEASHVIIAIAALVGLFSQQAALKLSDIANAILSKPGQGIDAKPQSSLTPGEGASGKSKPTGAKSCTLAPASGPGGQIVKITGTGLSSVKTVTFDGTPSADPPVMDQGTITAKAPPHAPGPVEVVVASEDGKSVRATFTYA